MGVAEFCFCERVDRCVIAYNCAFYLGAGRYSKHKSDTTERAARQTAICLMYMLSVDPGIRGCGIACFADGVLYGAAYVESPLQRSDLDVAACVAMARAVVAYCAWSTPGGFDEVVCEWPQIYTPGKMKGDPNDLPPLVGVDCAICASYPNAKHVSYRPAEWKGGLPKFGKSGENPMEQRVMLRLDEKERAAIWWPSAKSLAHNVTDSLGLGLFHLGRFERYRVIAR